MSAKRWVVIEPAGGPSGTLEPSAQARFVKDAFSPLAFLFPFFWFFWHRLWLAGLVVLVLYVASLSIGAAEGLSGLSVALQFGLSLLVGLEARDVLVRSRLSKGWRLAGVFHADNRSEAETRYYHQEGSTPAAKDGMRSGGARSTLSMPWTAPPR